MAYVLEPYEYHIVRSSLSRPIQASWKQNSKPVARRKTWVAHQDKFLASARAIALGDW